MSYSIVRFRQDGPNEILVRGLTEAQAQTHCQRPDTSGDGWFDGYVWEQGCDNCGEVAHPDHTVDGVGQFCSESCAYAYQLK